MKNTELIALDDSGVELSSPAGLPAFAPAPRMSALERFQMMESDPDGYRKFAEAEAARIDERIFGAQKKKTPAVVPAKLAALPDRAVTPVQIPDGGYQRDIALWSPVPLSLDGCRWVEAWMRIEHGTLNHLSEARVKKEIRIALDCIIEAGADDSEALAQSFGL